MVQAARREGGVLLPLPPMDSMAVMARFHISYLMRFFSLKAIILRAGRRSPWPAASQRPFEASGGPKRPFFGHFEPLVAASGKGVFGGCFAARKKGRPASAPL